MTVDNRQASPYKALFVAALAPPTLHFFHINFTASLRTLDPLSSSDLQFLYVPYLKNFLPFFLFCLASTEAATSAVIKQSTSSVFCTCQ